MQKCVLQHLDLLSSIKPKSRWFSILVQNFSDMLYSHLNIFNIKSYVVILSMVKGKDLYRIVLLCDLNITRYKWNNKSWVEMYNYL